MANILIVNNHPTLRGAFAGMLTLSGITANEIWEVGDITESLNLLSQGKMVNLIVFNADLFDNSSIEFIKTLRTKRRFVPILITFTEGDEEIIGDAVSAGAIDFIKMPFTPEQLQVKAVRLACELKCIYCGNCKQ
jgi:DNA-binding NtrC family response regulator